MSIQRIFMDWNQPALRSAVEILVRRYADKKRQRLDLDNVLVVVAGSRAGRRLSQMLAEKAAELKVPLFPPRIQTVGMLPENLYRPQRPFAGELVQHLAWIEAIRHGRSRARKFFPNLPDSGETMDWLELAAMLARIHRELAADGLDFRDVVDQGRKLAGFTDSRRWNFLRSLQESYLDVLDGLKLWDLQTARLVAIRNQECQTDLDVFLLATVDLNQATRQILDQVARQVTALIHAPESEALGFDDYGCLDPLYWKEKKIPLGDDQVLITDQPGDQADAVTWWMDEIEPPVATNEVVVGVPSAEVAPYVERKLKSLDVQTHWAVGRPLRETSPFKLLEALSSVIENERYADVAALLRHPDFERWLSLKQVKKLRVDASRVIGECDDYFVEHLVPGFSGWLGKDQKQENLRWAIRQLHQLLTPFRKKSSQLKDWATPILELVTDLYADYPLDVEDESHAGKIKCLSEIRKAVEAFLEIPDALDIKTSAVNAIRMVLQSLQSQHVTPQARRNSVDLLGWLELSLDIAPNVIVTSFNEGAIPESLNADMFLPNRLRRALGLMDNDRRYARDAYTLSSMAHSKRTLKLIVGKRNLAGDPLTPSRLYFASNRETIARRVVSYTNPVSFQERAVATQQLSDQSDYFVPRPELKDLNIETISVTSFRSYLKCPYRFYLQHVLKLRSIHDEDREFNGMVFGNIVHELLHRFGEHRVRLSESPTEISEYLEDELDRLILAQYGKRRLPAVEIQLQQMRHRLQGFAEWQAGRTRAGWEIRFVERRPLDPKGIPFPFENGKTVGLKGTIDRVDFHPDQQAWQILDYKTGDAGDGPQRTHFEKGEWVDLQLPLYKYIAEQEFEVEGNVDLGYILIPKDPTKIKESMAEWSDEQIESAWAKARECCRRIVRCDFWEPVYPAPPYVGKEYAAICQDDVFEPRLEPATGQQELATGGRS